jgi:radical SAM superfamily enzyme with C-terminal helix-hairpin-helix motif
MAGLIEVEVYRGYHIMQSGVCSYCVSVVNTPNDYNSMVFDIYTVDVYSMKNVIDLAHCKGR